MDLKNDNSFFHQDLRGLNVLAIVPHEDDEINTCGALLKTLTDCGAAVTLVYTTNGDWKYPALNRMKEAKDSAGFLGIKADHLLFLGYGDSYNNDKRDHIFYAVDTPAKTTAGHTETYGTKLYPDYAYQLREKHQPYIRASYLADLISVLENEKADFIICTDFDEHPDHRILSLLFDQAVGIVCKRNPDYHPEIWKRFAYSLAYTAIPDYCAINNPETKRPELQTTDKYAFDLVDKSIYSWKERIRIPVPHKDGETLRTNFISKALLRHKSQRIITHADRIVNSDEVYWKRRTDNLALLADVTVSSGNGAYLNDFVLYHTEDIDSPVPIFTNYYWQPQPDDTEKQAVFHWDSPQHIEKIVLYSSMDSGSRIKELSIRLSDGSTYTVKDIPNDGTPCVVETGPRDHITDCVIEIKVCEGPEYGLSECEFFAVSAPESHIKPFIKIISEDNFLYEYVISMDLDRICLDLYSYGLEPADYSFKIIQGNAYLEGNCLHINPAERDIILKCVCREAWDQIKIRRLDRKELSDRKQEVSRDVRYMKRERKSLKLHNMLYILKKQGPYSVLERTVKNVIKPGLRKLKRGNK